jgi:hypothetical protein
MIPVDSPSHQQSGMNLPPLRGDLLLAPAGSSATPTLVDPVIEQL